MQKEGNFSNQVALTIDIEDWYHLPPITGLRTSKYADVPSFFQSWHNSYDCLSRPTVKILDMLQELNLKATFFIVADVIQYYPGLVENIASRGHEIACHGYGHQLIYRLSPQEFRKDVSKAKNILEIHKPNAEAKNIQFCV